MILIQISFCVKYLFVCVVGNFFFNPGVLDARVPYCPTHFQFEGALLARDLWPIRVGQTQFSVGRNIWVVHIPTMEFYYQVLDDNCVVYVLGSG